MYSYISPVFNQILSIVPRAYFEKIAWELWINKYAKDFDARDCFTCLLYAQIDDKDSLRDIEIWLRTHEKQLYHLWIKHIARSNLSYRINKKLKAVLLEKVYYWLLDWFNRSYTWDKNHKCVIGLYHLDSTTISLCLSLFNRAKFRTTKWWIKLHTLLCSDTIIPEYIHITEAKLHDTKWAYKVLDHLPTQSIVGMDRWYVDYKLWWHLDKNWKFFVTRTKTTTKYIVTHQLLAKEISTEEGTILSDCEVLLTEKKAKKDYPHKLRIVRFHHTEQDKTYEYITNIFHLSVELIVAIYKDRRTIELFFKWIKQHLHIKSFYWTSENAVKCQIWTAMIYYIILLIIVHQNKLTKEVVLTLHRSISSLLFTNVSLHFLIPRMWKNGLTVDIKVDEKIQDWLFEKTT